MVNRRTEIKFLIMLGDTKTLLRTIGRLGALKENDPIEVTGSKAPLSTMIDEGPDKEGGRGEERIPKWVVMCEPAPESAYHSAGLGGGVKDIVLKLLMRDACSQDPPDMGFHGAGVGGVPDEEAEDAMGAPPPYAKPGGGANDGANPRGGAG